MKGDQEDQTLKEHPIKFQHRACLPIARIQRALLRVVPCRSPPRPRYCTALAPTTRSVLKLCRGAHEDRGRVGCGSQCHAFLTRRIPSLQTRGLEVEWGIQLLDCLGGEDLDPTVVLIQHAKYQAVLPHRAIGDKME